MLTFKQFILREKWEATLKSPYNNDYYDVHRNPSKNELKRLVKKSKYGSLRGITHPDGNAYVWDAHHAIHDDVHQGLNLHGVHQKHYINIKSDSYDSEYGSDNKNHPWVNKNLEKHRFFHS